MKHVGGSMMICGCFSKNGVENLFKIHGKLTASVYVHNLQQNLTESADRMGLVLFVFQQDNDCKHTLRMAGSFFLKKHHFKVGLASPIS